MDFKDRIEIVQGDITAESVDAIVNAANTELILGSGVAGAIRVKGGPAIQDKCSRHGPIELGRAALTTGGYLQAKYVIHAAAMHLGGKPTAESIRNATLNSLKIAHKEQMPVISFPALGTGVGGFSMSEAAEIMLSTTVEFLRENDYPKVVRFVLFDSHAHDVFEEILDSLSN
ncbi:macro domain-containing protein [bacterium]|nr:macro domain-containing protein [bacterium]